MTQHGQSGSRRRRANGAACLTVTLLVWSVFATALRGQESIGSTEDHLVIAARYRQEAAAAREAIKRHQITLEVYRRGTEKPYTVMNPQGRQRMSEHCERLVTHYTDAAKELDGMAAEHEALATQLRSPAHSGEQK